MSNLVTKTKGLIFIFAGLFWLVAVFVKSWPTVGLTSASAVLFFLSTICGFGVMSIGTSLLENNTNK